MTEQVNVPKKRGRKPKVNVENQESSQTELKVPKKRGRKPKGGKIINIVDSQQGIRVPIPNIILHLKCSLSDLETNKLISSISYNPEVENVESFQFFQNKTHDLNMLTINDDTNEPSRQTNTNTNKIQSRMDNNNVTNK